MGYRAEQPGPESFSGRLKGLAQLCGKILLDRAFLNKDHIGGYEDPQQ